MNLSRYSLTVKVVALCKYSGINPRLCEFLFNYFREPDDLFKAGADTLMKIDGMDRAIAGNIARTAERLGTKTVDHSGWHVYANMEHVNAYLKDRGRPYGKGAYPVTDDILRRSINLSVGVVDTGLGSAFGINIDASDDEIEKTAETFRDACRE